MLRQNQSGYDNSNENSNTLQRRRQVQAVQKTWDIGTVLKNNNFYTIFTMTEYQNVRKNKLT
jgi:hypothetical protein